MSKIRLITLLLIALVGALSAACSIFENELEEEAQQSLGTPAIPTAGALTIRAGEWKFVPHFIFLRQGEEVTITLQNDGEIVHNLKVDDIEADVASNDDGEVFVQAEKGDSAQLVFTPRKEGGFTYYCSIPDHRELGMEGTLVVGFFPTPTGEGPVSPSPD